MAEQSESTSKHRECATPGCDNQATGVMRSRMDSFIYDAA